ILDKLVPGTSDGYTLDTYPGNSLRMIVQGGICRFDAHLSVDHWTYVAGVYSASQKIMALYIDGKQVAALATSDFPLMTVAKVPLRVGSDPNGDNRFHGRILRAAIWGRALSAAEIMQRAANPVRLPGLIAEWQFPGKPGQTLLPTAGALSLTDFAWTHPTPRLVGEASAPAGALSLWYRRPAKEWLEALPLGNGRLGAMVFGGVPQERLQLNEGTVWAGGPHDYDNPEALAALPEVRRLIFADQWNEAQSLIDSQCMGKPVGQMPYQTVGNLTLTFPAPESVANYRRELDLDTAIARTTYEANSIRFAREAFASAPDQVIILRLTADKPGQISFTAAFDSPQKSDIGVAHGHTLVLDGISGDRDGLAGSVKFQARARAVCEGGLVRTENGLLTVTGANAVSLFVSIGTSYKNYKDVGGDPAASARTHLEAAARKAYSHLRQAHIEDHQRLFHRVALDLGRSEAMAMPTDERIAAFKNNADPQLAALHFQYGRYLLISCSRPGGQPATLQGLWNDSLSPPWGSKYTVNINTEMNYWPAAPANMIECVEPLFGLLSDISVTGQQTAKVHYGARGWVCHHNTDGWRGTAPVDGHWGITPTCGAWLALSLWNAYQFTHDKAALRTYYPILKGAAEFFLDALVEEPKHHWLVTNPTASPEIPHHAAQGAFVCAGATLDMQILRDLFQACAEASDLLGVDADFRTQAT
ncbi:MAG: glycoside hydrolase N-terminal domain-containing protein, partial [Armatimonadota bacterium]|nr:glycoside hydrolase N-terminal domain-containing protein [Armatimonadota bacterium]